ncbi:Uncharacterised protein [Mycobacterium tuberculosis]|nr:Uncharacterised protein [Mycobacterium tuberculosis]
MVPPETSSSAGDPGSAGGAGLGAQLRPRHERSRIAIDDDMAQGGVIGNKFARHRPIVEPAGHIGDHQPGGRADGGEVAQFGGAVTGQAHHWDRSRPQ